MPIRGLQKLGENSTGDKAGVELPGDNSRLEGLLDEDGELVERPPLETSRVDEGEWRIRRLNRDDVGRRSD